MRKYARYEIEKILMGMVDDEQQVIGKYTVTRHRPIRAAMSTTPLSTISYTLTGESDGYVDIRFRRAVDVLYAQYRKSAPKTVEEPEKPCLTVEEPEKPCLKLWPWADAPAELQALSADGGDEDWVLFVPSALMANAHVAWWVPDTSGLKCWLHPFGWGIGYEHPLGRVAIFSHT